MSAARERGFAAPRAVDGRAGWSPLEQPGPGGRGIAGPDAALPVLARDAAPGCAGSAVSCAPEAPGAGVRGVEGSAGALPASEGGSGRNGRVARVPRETIPAAADGPDDPATVPTGSRPQPGSLLSRPGLPRGVSAFGTVVARAWGVAGTVEGAALGALCLAAMGASLAAAPGLDGILAAALVPVLAAIAVIDARRFLIPDGLNAAGLVLGLAHAALAPAALDRAALTLPDALAGMGGAAVRGMALAAVFLALRAGFAAVRGREGLGLGDVKLAAVAGVWLEVETIPIAVEIAAVSALVAHGLALLLPGRARRRLPAWGGRRPSARLPFGLFLAPAIWIGWLLDRWLSGGLG